MVGVVKQRLQALAQPQPFGVEGRRIGRKIEVARQLQARGIRHRQPALKTHRRFDRQRAADEIDTRRHQNRTPAGQRVRRRRGKGREIIGHAVADRAIVAHIHPIHHVAQPEAGHVLDDNVVDAHHAAGRPCQIKAQMPIGHARPVQIDAALVAGGNDRADLDHFAIGRQRDLRRAQRDTRHRAATGIRRIARNPHIRQRAADRLHPHPHAQIETGLDRRLPLPAQALRARGLEQLQATVEIGVRRHEGRVGRPVITGRAGRAIAAGPHGQPIREGWRHQNKPVGHCLVHLRPLS